MYDLLYRTNTHDSLFGSMPQLNGLKTEGWESLPGLGPRTKLGLLSPFQGSAHQILGPELVCGLGRC